MESNVFAIWPCWSEHDNSFMRYWCVHQTSFTRQVLQFKCISNEGQGDDIIPPWLNGRMNIFVPLWRYIDWFIFIVELVTQVTVKNSCVGETVTLQTLSPFKNECNQKMSRRWINKDFRMSKVSNYNNRNTPPLCLNL